MGFLNEGQWSTQWYKPDAQGRFQREPTVFHGKIALDGPHPPAAGRYHLYVSLACPWAHRTLIMRRLQGLEEAISVTVVDPHMGDDGWAFSQYPGCEPDPMLGAAFLREVYVAANAKYTGRVTVPVLWDKERKTIVNNESREILRAFDHEFAPWAKHPRDYCPPALRQQVDGLLDDMYDPINNGVYRSGFATTQRAYEEAVTALFAALDQYDARLGKQRFLCGDVFTEADICLFTTLVRFDPVYVGHFKCNVRRIADYANLSGYLRDVYQLPGVKDTCDFEHIKRHYYWSHAHINPTRIVPVGPDLDLEAPHGRGT